MNLKGRIGIGIAMAAVLLFAIPVGAQDAAHEARRAALSLLSNGNFAEALSAYSQALPLSGELEHLAIVQRGRARSFEGLILTALDDATRLQRYRGAVAAYEAALAAVRARSDAPPIDAGLTETGLRDRIRVLAAPTEALERRLQAARQALLAPVALPSRSHALAWAFMGTGATFIVASIILGVVCTNASRDVRDMEAGLYRPDWGVVDIRDYTCGAWPFVLAAGTAAGGAGLALRLARDGSERPAFAPAIRANADGIGIGATLRF